MTTVAQYWAVVMSFIKARPLLSAAVAFLVGAILF